MPEVKIQVSVFGQPMFRILLILLIIRNAHSYKQ